MSRALIVVDVQNDFCEGGSLAVTGGAQVAADVTSYVNRLRKSAGGPGDIADAGTGTDVGYSAVVGTLDWHIDPGTHFSAHPDFVSTWPAHCVVGSEGSHPHPALDQSLIEAWFRKGRHQAAYSGFEGSTDGPDGTSVGLGDWLRERGVTSVDVVGIATDHCVRATALDAIGEGFATRVLLGLTAAVAPQTEKTALAELRDAGAELILG